MDTSQTQKIQPGKTKKPPNRLALMMVAASCLLWHLLDPRIALAFQEHGAKEGLYVHQLGHICFGAAMAWLFFMIRRSSFWRRRCWKSVAAGSALLALWNAVTFTGHIISLYSLKNCPTTLPQDAGLKFWVWYSCKLDNIICVAAMCFFYAGLKQLLEHLKSEEPGDKGGMIR